MERSGLDRERYDIKACLAGCLSVCLICYAYFFLNGRSLQVTYGDTWILVDLAKRIALNHSLGMDKIFDLVYPPLYPALIAPAYIFKDPAIIFTAVHTLNVLVYATAFVPLFYLLRDYAGLTRALAFCGSLLLLANLWPLKYTAHISSEPIYYPLAAWLTWLVIEGAYLRGTGAFALFTAVFAALPLTKALGNIVFPVFASYCCVMYFFAERPRPHKLLTRPFLAMAISAAIVYAYKKYQFSVLPQGSDITGGYLYNLSFPNLREFSYWIDRTRLDASWLVRGTKTAAFPICLALLLRHRRLIGRDPLAVFSGLIFAATFIVVPLFTPGDPMFREHPRYFIPFVFSFVVLLLKYRGLVDGKDLLLSVFILTAGIAAGFPSDFMGQPVRWQIFGYYCVWFTALYLGRKRLAGTLLVLMSLSVLSWGWSDRKPPSEEEGRIVSFYDQRGITAKILELRKADPDLKLVVDQSWRGHDLEVWREYQRVMTGIPFLPVFAEPIGQIKANEKERLLLTDRPVRKARKLVQGDHISLYLLKGPALR